MADVPLAVLVICITKVVRPFVGRWFPGPRIVFVPLMLGLALGVLTEYHTAQLDLFMAWRRFLLYGFVPAAMYRTGRIVQDMANGGA